MGVLSERRQKGFWERVDKTNPTGCWIWRGQRTPGGYGFIEVGKRMQMAHRVSLIITGSDINGLIVHHTCGNRLCVNPCHLLPVQDDREHFSHHTLWTKSAIINAIRSFALEFGEPPRQNDWEPTASTRRGQLDRAQRYLERKGEWPSAPTVCQRFGNWGNAIEASGFPRPKRGGLDQ